MVVTVLRPIAISILKNRNMRFLPMLGHGKRARWCCQAIQMLCLLKVKNGQQILLY